MLENITVNCMWQHRSSLVSELLSLPDARAAQAAATAHARRMIGEFDLAQFSDQPIESLPFGTQKRVEIARAIASTPKLLLLDEPAAGLNPLESASLAARIRDLRDRYGVTIVLIEHDMSLVMEVCERIVVLDHGVKISEGISMMGSL